MKNNQYILEKNRHQIYLLGNLGNNEDAGDDGELLEENNDGENDFDWFGNINKGLQLLNLGTQVANNAVDLSENWNTGQTNNNQFTQEQISAQQRLAQQRNIFANRQSTTTQNNTMLYVGVGVGVLALGGLAWWAFSK